MKKNLGIKVLCAVMVSAVALVLINTRHPAVSMDKSTEISAVNTSINTQFNDNIRDVLARLLETEKK